MYMRSDAQMLAERMPMTSPEPGGSSTSTTRTLSARSPVLRTAFIPPPGRRGEEGRSVAASQTRAPSSPRSSAQLDDSPSYGGVVRRKEPILGGADATGGRFRDPVAHHPFASLGRRVAATRRPECEEVRKMGISTAEKDRLPDKGFDVDVGESAWRQLGSRS